MIVTEFPRRVREIENIFIPLSDGTRLATRIFLPEDAGQDPVPAILEFLPYRKRDGTAERDALTHPWFAGHGYAGVRVDMRGSGESDGLLDDEYLKQEQDDCIEVIAWLAAQPWCSGAVGMMGISWGGFNGLQVAARRPPALKAVVTLCSTDDRYADDIHFMGGALLTANQGWGATMFGYMTRPPDPAIVGERWRELWLDRLRHMPLLTADWLEHQRRDALWTHGSVCEDYGAIEAAVFAIGGWSDGYSNAIPRLLANLRSPCLGLIGPWAHKYPHFALPGPKAGFLQEALRFWDQFLKGRDTGIMREPKLRAWMLESARPRTWYAERPGRWVGEAAWPPPGRKSHRLFLVDQALTDAGGAEAALAIASPETVGLAAGAWCPHGVGADEPGDQREEDAKSLVFDAEPLAARLEILGAPVVELEVAADRPNAKLAVRLCDVHPDGASTRVTYGILNLTHRECDDAPTPLEPGRRYRVRIQLNDIAYAFPAGHRIRVAISTTYWPITWPSPERTEVTLFAGASHLELPVRPPRAEDAAIAPLPPAESAAPERRTVLRAGTSARQVTRDLVAGITSFRSLDDSGDVRIDAHGLEVGSVKDYVWSIADEDPTSAVMTSHWTMTVGRGEWRTRSETRTVMRSTATEFVIDAELDAFEGDVRVWSANWHRVIPRDLV